MPEFIIGGIAVNFPFEPYEVQKVYMEKVIMCLDTSTHALLESPTGTGKTLSLLCSTLAWITEQKKMSNVKVKQETATPSPTTVDELTEGVKAPGPPKGIPKVIYASRTHSQLNQAMNELKRTSYSFMRAVCLGSRDQLCIHPEVSQVTSNSVKIQMCKLHLTTRSCSYGTNVEKNKDDPRFTNQSVVDIEDLVKVGRKLRTCPYFVSKELVESADVVFMPYNYLLDPKARKSHNVQLENTIIILDEAHNIEKICEESVSVQIKSSDIALCIEDLTQALKCLTDQDDNDHENERQEFTMDDVALLKEMSLELEKAIDEIEVKLGGVTYTAEFMFNLLEKANIRDDNQPAISKLLENLIQFLTVSSEGSSAVFRKGLGLERLLDLLTIVFVGNTEAREQVTKSFKVHIETEEIKKSTTKDGWVSSKGDTKLAKVVNYWCFNPGFCMKHLIQQNVRSVILTSGTLAPLTPLIAELGIPISHVLENPHIVDKSQVCVKIIPFGPDRELLNSSFKNRDNPKYITSLGRTILSFCPVTPGGLLVFFPSYSLMDKFKDSWQASGIWQQINKQKPILVEPRNKNAFSTTMTDFYANICNPAIKGACFMAVCRGKVSEGLDFADNNGRVVIITGLPYPPLKDSRVILKRQYLEDNRTKENQLLSGDHWYGLEASRAVNQAIGRVIRHKNDYGAILLCDSRFNGFNQKSQLSKWIQEHLKQTQEHKSFGPFVAEISRFFKNIQKTIVNSNICTEVSESNNASTSAIVRKREREISETSTGIQNRKKYRIVSENMVHGSSSSSSMNQCTKTDDGLVNHIAPTDRTDLLKLIKFSISPDFYSTFVKSVINYQKTKDFTEFFNVIKLIFDHPSIHYLFKGVRRFVQDKHKNDFDKQLAEFLNNK